MSNWARPGASSTPMSDNEFQAAQERARLAVEQMMRDGTLEPNPPPSQPQLDPKTVWENEQDRLEALAQTPQYAGVYAAQPAAARAPAPAGKIISSDQLDAMCADHDAGIERVRQAEAANKAASKRTKK